MPESQSPTTLEVLEAIVKRPGMYWGDSDNHFHSLVAFFSGYRMALGDGSDRRQERPLDLAIPEDFHQFVTEQYGHRFPHGGYGWMSFIEENTTSDREALELFLKLRKLYDDNKSANKS